jgi:hypothetical protein
MANLVRRTISSRPSLQVTDRLCTNQLLQSGRQLRPLSTLLTAVNRQDKQHWKAGNKDIQVWNPRQRIPQRQFSKTATHGRDHQFDTLKFVHKLKDEGFTEDQSVAMMKVLSDVIEER